MSLTLTLAPEIEKKLQERAAQSGQSVERFLYQLIEREVLGTPSAPAQSAKSLGEVLAPVRKGWKESGMTDEELADLVEEVREEIWQEKQAKKAP